jgi:hypothetical protein
MGAKHAGRRRGRRKKRVTFTNLLLRAQALKMFSGCRAAFVAGQVAALRKQYSLFRPD